MTYTVSSGTLNLTLLLLLRADCQETRINTHNFTLLYVLYVKWDVKPYPLTHSLTILDLSWYIVGVYGVCTPMRSFHLCKYMSARNHGDRILHLCSLSISVVIYSLMWLLKIKCRFVQVVLVLIYDGCFLRYIEAKQGAILGGTHICLSVCLSVCL